MGDQRPILNDLLQRVLAKHASECTCGYFGQTVDDVQTAQFVGQFQAVADPVKDNDREVELHVVATDADLRILQHLGLLVDLND